MNRFTISLLAISCSLLGACASGNVYRAGQSDVPRYDATDNRSENQSLLGPTFQGVDHLVSQMIRRANLSSPILVATPQNIVDLERSSEFALTLGELVQSRIAEHGFGVIEVKLQDRLRVNAAGELLLSRELADIASNQHADIVVVGTWSESSKGAYVTLKAVRVNDGVLVASSSFAIEGGRKHSLPSF